MQIHRELASYKLGALEALIQSMCIERKLEPEEAFRLLVALDDIHATMQKERAAEATAAINRTLTPRL